MKSYVDYSIVLCPSESVGQQVAKHKSDAEGLIGSYQDPGAQKTYISVKSMPRRKPHLAEPEIRGLTHTVRMLPPVTLTLEGFDFFTHGDQYRTIYAKIKSTQQTIQWFKALKKSIDLREYLVPHITIARNIGLSAHHKLWPHFKAIRWVEDFRINHLTFLQREALNHSARLQNYLEIPFEGQELTTDSLPKPSLMKPLSGNYSNTQQISLF